MKNIMYSLINEVGSQIFDKIWEKATKSSLERLRNRVDLSIWDRLWILQKEIRIHK